MGFNYILKNYLSQLKLAFKFENKKKTESESSNSVFLEYKIGFKLLLVLTLHLQL